MTVKPYSQHLLGFSKNTSYSLKQKINYGAKGKKKIICEKNKVN